MKQNASRQSTLGRFLRKKREALSPEAFGFSTARRRTPGLRREEVAALAGVSLTWYAWLEQGRADGVSVDVLHSLADILRMTPDEREYLFELANAKAELPARPVDDVPPSAQLLLDHLTAPAYMMDPYWNVLCWNRLAAQVFGDFGGRTERDRNLMWFMFSSEEARAVTSNWYTQAQQMVAAFQADYARYFNDASFNEWVEVLSRESQDFAALWRALPVQRRHDRRKEFHHPVLGKLSFIQTTTQLVDNRHLRLVVFLPDPTSPTAARLQEVSSE